MSSRPNTPDAPTGESFEGYLERTRERRLESFIELLRFPSISGIPAHAPDVRAAADWIAADLLGAGMEHVTVEETGGHPIVFADWLHAPGAPTVLVYAHYDVQPVDPLDLWESPPFEPVVVGDRLQARGAADDKCHVHLHARVFEALLATEGRLPLNVKVVFEGEEESTSLHLEQWLLANRERLGADAAIISDTGFFEGNRPSITVGLRGTIACQIDVYGGPIDLHSGMYGGAVQNPVNALCTIVAALKGPDGRIRIPGFYDDVDDLSQTAREAIAALPFDEEAYREHVGVPALVGEAGFTTLERRTVRPTLDVNGIWGGFQGAGGKTIIPAHAHAKVTCRIVPSQDPGRICEALVAYVREIAPPGVRVEVNDVRGTPASLTPLDHPATMAAARAIEATFGVEPLYVREGGSVPVCAMFERALGLPVVMLGFMPSDCRAHAPNEYMDLRNYETGLRTVARYWRELAAGRTERRR
jgi:acetylornithine deacetylase/succinyl-diaminopimelate desuccinylase-like protein